MATEITGSVWGFDKKNSVVAIQFGLTPKVVRFATDEQWVQGEEVVVTVTRNKMEFEWPTNLNPLQ